MVPGLLRDDSLVRSVRYRNYRMLAAGRSTCSSVCGGRKRAVTGVRRRCLVNACRARDLSPSAWQGSFYAQWPCLKVSLDAMTRSGPCSPSKSSPNSNELSPSALSSAASSLRRHFRPVSKLEHHIYERRYQRTSSSPFMKVTPRKSSVACERRSGIPGRTTPSYGPIRMLPSPSKLIPNSA